MTIHWLERIAPRPRIVGEQPAQPGWIEPTRVIYDHEVVLFGDSTFQLEIEGESFVCLPESFVIVPPGQWHTSWLDGPRPGRRAWMHFDWTAGKAQADAPVLTYAPAAPDLTFMRRAPRWMPARLLHGRIERPGHVWDLHHRLSHRWNAGTPRDRATARALCLELLLELLHESPPAHAARPIPDHLAPRIRTLLDHIAQQPVSGMPSIQHQLRSLGYSYEHLCRHFRSTYGISPLSYTQAVRIERARQLLRDTLLNVTEISRQVGFDRPGYFTRLFQQRTGHTPTGYRRNLPRPVEKLRHNQVETR
ncbi:helix-turn-helix transcriptional regulator [Phycisphaerales bacterium AB-hyl4]|uniref:Helix-turn-helix transcriptional regulator n=1 Tax=Natronomicrosphaera hydrolytica TaxID=3242702 RepID=A0ABV4U9Y7_9BACT